MSFEFLSHIDVFSFEHMKVLKHHKRQLRRWLGGPAMRVSLIRTYLFADMGANMGATNSYISGYGPFPKMIVLHNAS